MVSQKVIHKTDGADFNTVVRRFNIEVKNLLLKLAPSGLFTPVHICYQNHVEYDVKMPIT